MARLPILMYHNVCHENEKGKGLTISANTLEEHLKFVSRNFTTISFSDFKNQNLPNKSLLITFDDVTQNQLLYAIPLLKKYHLKATFFIPFAYIGKTDVWNSNKSTGNQKIMTIEELKSIENDFELGYHSYAHQFYDSLSEQELILDFENCVNIIEKNNLKVYPVLAYPYGNYPRKGIAKNIFFTILEKYNIQFAVRIGNKINQLPVKNKFELCRIDVKGEDSIIKFRLKLLFGKLKLF